MEPPLLTFIDNINNYVNRSKWNFAKGVCRFAINSFKWYLSFHSTSAIFRNKFLEMEVRQVCSQYTPVSVFRIVEGVLLTATKLLVSWKGQEEYIRLKYQKTDPSTCELKWDFFYACWGYRVTREKLLKVINSAVRKQVYYGQKE